MTPRDLCAAYLAALDNADLEAVRALFSPDGLVVSPLYGVKKAHDFYASLFADTNRSETTLLGIFEAAQDGGSVALHFQYVWTMKSGKVVTFECVDVFELTEDRQKFQKLTIIYDTAPLRDEFNGLRDRRR